MPTNLSPEDLAAIRASTKTYAELAKDHGVSASTIRNIVKYEGRYAGDLLTRELVSPRLSLEEVLEGYGALDLDELELNDGEPETLSNDDLFLLDNLVRLGGESTQPLPNTQYVNLGNPGYLRLRETPDQHFIILTEEGELRHALEYHRGWVPTQPKVQESAPQGRAKSDPKKDPPTQLSLFTPDGERRIVEAIERLVTFLTRE